MKPAGQRLHSILGSSSSSEYLPAGHGSGLEAPRGQKLPEVQDMQDVALLFVWNLPDSHAVHCLCPGSELKLPGRQAAGSVDPGKQALPAPHRAHSNAAERFVCELNRPDGQGVAVILPSGQ
mmetsp:Transcript_10819/g.24144  ORF Transcript_10819/g.24144 Transcript_10819/m.24144 type:complete len:122 (+) Transcript_10819:1178-1543(+)